MDRKSKILLSILLILLVVSAAYKFYVFVIERDYVIAAEVSCDPSEEPCFVWNCSLEDPECDQTPYKYITKNAKNAPVCDPYTEECNELVCEAGEPECEYTVCSEETLSEEEFCLYEPITEEMLEPVEETGETDTMQTTDDPLQESETDSSVSSSTDVTE